MTTRYPKPINTVAQDVMLVCKYHYRQDHLTQMDILQAVLAVHLQTTPAVAAAACYNNLTRVLSVLGDLPKSLEKILGTVEKIGRSPTMMYLGKGQSISDYVLDSLASEIAVTLMRDKEGNSLYPEFDCEVDPAMLGYLSQCKRPGNSHGTTFDDVKESVWMGK